jgi:RNA polymerase sigma-70 factor (ECF subfamily)
MTHALTADLLRGLASRATSLRRSGAGEGASDAELVLRARDGDRRAVEAIYRRHVRYVAGMVRRLVGRQGDAEDLVQEAFVVALSGLEGLREPEALKGWIAQIAVSLVRRRFRRQRLLRALRLDAGADERVLEALASADASPEVRAELAALDRVLARLPADQRVAWVLRRVEGESLEEVARLCRRSLATVKRWIGTADREVAAHCDTADGEVA